MNTIADIQKEIIEEFSFFEDWQQKYEYLIELGKSVSILPEATKTQDKLISGCQSSVWLNAKLDGNKIILEADSDAILPKGIIALLLRIYSNQPVEDVINSNTDFISEIGLQEFLSPTRANGLLAMIKQIKLYALALKTQIQ